jgi:hypothetical protein
LRKKRSRGFFSSKINTQKRYLALFVNRDKESKQVRELLNKHKISIQEIEVNEQNDVPRLVTSERVFIGIRGIKDYLDNWAKLEKLITA